MQHLRMRLCVLWTKTPLRAGIGTRVMASKQDKQRVSVVIGSQAGLPDCPPRVLQGAVEIDANLQQAASNRRPNSGKIKLEIVGRSEFGSVIDSQGGVSLDWRWGSH